MSDATISVHLPKSRALELVEEAGWTICTQSSDHGPVVSYTRPGKKTRREGGKFGTDWLWELDETLTRVLEGKD